MFGARIEAPCYAYPDVTIWAPWRLTMRRGSCLGPGVVCYNVEQVTLGRDALISQRSHLCTASHDFDDPSFALTGAPIVIEDGAWVAAEAFVGPGVHVGERAVILARAVVVHDTPCGVVLGGNPARYIRDRATQESSAPEPAKEDHP
jgi:putative colanic acid biosynthesis acetyltransferase WcaF